MARQTKVGNAQARVSSDAAFIVKPTAGDVLKKLSASDKTKLAQSIARERGHDLSTKEGKQKTANIRRTIERQTTTTGSQKRGAVKGLNQEYREAIEKQFKEKLKPTIKKKFKAIKIEMKATYDFYGSDKRHRPVTFTLNSDQAQAFAEAGDEASAVHVLLESAPNSMAEAEVTNIERVRIK